MEWLGPMMILPDNADMDHLLEASNAFASGASTILEELLPMKEIVRYKDANKSDPVTNVDLRIEDYLKREISREFPDHSIIAEETDDQTIECSDFVWVIDPLDGTKNFAAGLPFYSVSIGLLYLGIPIIGSILMPDSVMGSGLYSCKLGGGAYLNGERLGILNSPEHKVSALSVVPSGFRQSFYMVGDSTRSSGSSNRSFGELRTMGSIASEMVLVARGIFGCGIFSGGHIWDVAAGILLIREAGGEVMILENDLWVRFSGFTTPSQDDDTVNSQSLRDWGGILIAGPESNAQYLRSIVRPRKKRIKSR